MPPDGPTRREFVSDAAALAFGATVVPRHVLGGAGRRAPSDTLDVAIVGAGGMGTENAQELLDENIVAVCDVDFAYVERKVEERTEDDEGPREKGLAWRERFREANRYADFRVMLERERSLDAVVVATPDHLHAHIAKAAMEAGKHVYVQKPLTYSVYEARVLAETAERTGVATQMGNQGRSMDTAMLIDEWVQAGVLGTVREVHVWTNRPIWPQGVPRPAALDDDDPGWGRGGVASRLADALSGAHEPPEHLRWDLYVGPLGHDVAYHPMYHPFNWRGWVDFGVGALGDMGAHLIDHPYSALKLGYPTAIEATSTPWGGPQDDPVTYPIGMTARYEFPRRGILPPVELFWYDGGLMPPRPSLLPPDVELKREGGVLFVGERGVLMHETYGRNPQLFPEGLREEAEAVPEKRPRVEASHEMNWAMACRGEADTTSPFSYAAPLTEVMLLGIVALRSGQGNRIEYDGASMTITNDREANRFLTRPYREGWLL